MKFEYDENKSQTNEQKYGIDFLEAQKLWQDENTLIVDDETRFALISKILGKYYVAILP